VQTLRTDEGVLTENLPGKARRQACDWMRRAALGYAREEPSMLPHAIGNAATSQNEDTARRRLQATGRIEGEPRMGVEHVARAVVYMATLPLDANVQFMTVMATKMPYIGRG
jgi:NADP-dependent 3-hydroxy acid dehydrogenase YdfG